MSQLNSKYVAAATVHLWIAVVKAKLTAVTCLPYSGESDIFPFL